MFCGQCGAQIQDGSKFCNVCGTPTAIVEAQQAQPMAQQQMPIQQFQPSPQPQQQSSLVCPNCGGNNIQVQLVEQGQMTTKKGVGFGGHINNAARATTAVMTLGMSNLVWKKSKGTNKTKTVNSTMGVCQSCGHTWEIQQGKTGSAPSSIFR